MSDVFALDQAGQNDKLATASANLTDGVGPPGFWKGVPKAVGMAVPRGLAEIPRAIELAGALPVGVAEPFLGYKQGELTDKYFAAVDPTIKNAVDYWTPRPEEVGTAGRILGGAVEGLAQLAAGGFNPAVLIGTTTLTGAMDAADQGASPDVAAASGALQGVATAAGFKLPFLGKTLLTRVASGAAGNVALGRLSTLAQQQLLARTGNPEAAANYNPADLTGAATDLLMGIAYGAVAHATSPAERAAALTTLDAQHFQEGTAPGTPADTASSVAHQQAIELAIKQILNGEPVTPPAPIMGAGFVPRSPAERLPPLRSTATDKADREAMDHIVSVLSGAKSRGVPLAEDLANLDAERALTVAHENPPPGEQDVTDTIPRDQTLTPEHRAIETAFAQQLGRAPTAAEAAYALLADTQGGKVLSTDTARELSDAYLKDRTVSAAVHEPASWLIKRLYARLLTQPPKAGEENLVLFTAGGTGAGKSTAINKALGPIADSAQIVYDTNLDNAPSAIKKIDQARQAGKKVKIAYVIRHPVEALTEGALTRAMRQEKQHGSGRTVPLNDHVRTHEGSYKAIQEIAQHYANDPGVEITVIDNTLGKGKARATTLEKMPKIDYNGSREEAAKALDAEYAAGRISASVYRGFAGKEPPSGTAAVGEGPGGQPQSERPEGNADRLTPATPAPAAPEAAPPGSTQDVLTPTGRRVPVTPRVVEASSLVTSDNPAFPQDLQPRDRQGRQALSDQVTSIGQNLTPELLGPSASSDTGAPIVGPGGVVESGNGRVMALRDVYAGRHPNSPEKAAAYRAYLESLGHDTTGIQHPVLVRERVGTMTPEERQAFTTESNKSTAAEFSPVELAQADAKLLDSATMSLLRGEDLTTEKNGDFRRAFMKKLSAGERNALVDASGNLSQEGERRLQAAILAKAYGGTPESNVTLGRLLESTSDEVRSALGALQDAAHAFAKLRQMIQDGTLGPEYDIAPAVLQAVEDVARLRRTKTSLAEHLATSDMFSPTSLVIKAFYDPTGNRVASREKAAAALERYASQAMHERTNQAALFSEAPLSPTDILQAKPAPQTGDMFGLRTPQTGSAPDPVVQSAQQMAVENPKLRVATGEFDANGNAVTVPVGELLAKSEADIAAAQEKAKAYEAAVGCAMAKGN